jgi:thiamine-phosphate pyrophosphorylase
LTCVGINRYGQKILSLRDLKPKENLKMFVLPPIKSWHLYVITDEHLSGGRTHIQIAEKAIAGGADVIQLRDKKASSRKLFQTALELRRLTREAGVTFIVNDRLDIALTVDADGLHIGRDDLPVVVARKWVKRDKILGVSATTLEEAVEAEAQGADYLGVGPIYEARGTKFDAGKPQGLNLLQAIQKHCNTPLIAIGGIQSKNVKDVIKAGAHGVAVISAVVSASDITAAVRELKELVVAARKS